MTTSVGEPWVAGQVVDLWGEDEGSFEFPPRPKTASDVVEFWRSVKIPESAARAIVSRQKLVAHEKGLVKFHVAVADYNVEHPKKQDAQERQRIAQEAYDKAYLSVPQFPQGEVYPSIRAAMMYRDAQFLPTGERASVENLRLRLPGGDMTPAQVWEFYDFKKLENELQNPEARSVAAMERMAKKLDEIQQMEAQRAEADSYGTLPGL